VDNGVSAVINDVLRVRKLEVKIFKAENELDEYRGIKSKERQLAALEVRKGLIEVKMVDRKVKIDGYAPALTRLEEIIDPLCSAYYTTAGGIMEELRWKKSQNKIIEHLDKLVNEGIKRPAPNQQP
jgi:hypothetical protein